MLRDNINVNKVDAGDRNSFEFSEWIIKHGSFTLRTIIIYRPPYSTNHPVTIRTFIAEFSTYLESIVMSSEPLLITGDFNIHVDQLSDPDSDIFLELLESMGFLQHVDKPTHRSGHTLDLIITRQCDVVLASAPTTDYFLSDHCSVLCDLHVVKPALPTKTISYRKIKDIDRQILRDELAETKLCLNSPNTLDDLVECYNSTLSSLLDRHAPLLTKRFKIRPLVLWFNNDIKQARKERRRAEKNGAELAVLLIFWNLNLKGTTPLIL